MGTLGIFQIQKSTFFKVADIVRKIDIWPENDILGVLEWFGSLIWYLESTRTNFENIETMNFDYFPLNRSLQTKKETCTPRL